MVAPGAQLAALPRTLDEKGMVPPYRYGDGLPRTAYMDGEQLMAAIQGIVRHELRAGLTRAGMHVPEGEGADYLTSCVAVGCERPGSEPSTLAMGVGPDALALLLPLCTAHAAILAQTGDEALAAPSTAPLVLG
jgi:hypothetical protein